jgi:putative transposase
MKKLSPPGYWKDRETGEKKIHILIRNDRYYLEPISEDEGYIVLEGFDLRIRYAGRIRWEGIESLKRTPYPLGGKKIRETSFSHSSRISCNSLS